MRAREEKEVKKCSIRSKLRGATQLALNKVSGVKAKPRKRRKDGRSVFKEKNENRLEKGRREEQMVKSK